jgi:sarcosine/dimethylglycine N-methyltransferase
MSGLEAHYSARDIEQRILTGLRAAGLNPEQRLSPQDLGSLDHFHTGGLAASLELMELAQIRAGDRVLDVGAGLAGCARLIASANGCRVDCIEMSPDYCAGAALLNRLTGLDVESQQVIPVEVESGGWRLSCQAGMGPMPVIAV